MIPMARQFAHLQVTLIRTRTRSEWDVSHCRLTAAG